MKKAPVLVLFPLIATLTVTMSWADQVSIYLENDFMFDTDHYFTHGTRVEYWPEIGNWNASVGQNMYTPDDKESSRLLPNDRPYAGYLYVASGIETNLSCFLVEAELQLGMTGPDAYAKEVQDYIHKITGSHLCQGWSNQLPNHAEAQTWLKFSYPTDLSSWFDAVPNATVAAGTVQDYASLGGTLYLGYNLPKLKVNKDIPIKLPYRQSRDFRLYLFGGAEARGVAYNAFLSDPRFDITLCPFVHREYMGFTAEYCGYVLTFQLEEISDEFKEQPAPEKFGSVQLTLRF